MSSMGELTFFLGLQVQQQPDGIFITQDKYVADILKKFDFRSIKTSTSPIESNKPLVKDEDGVDVDVRINRSMIGSLMYLTASRPYIMFVVCACARFQVTPKASHLNVVKRIFRYLKHQPKLRLWYLRNSPFELEAFSNSDYGGASLDRKSTVGECQFLGRRLISWQCKKQTIMANSTTEAEYVVAANCFKNPVYHSRTKHIEIRHHFIRDCYEKRLIDVVKIHTDNNVADLLTKGFDVTRFNFLMMTTLKYSDKHNMVAFLKKPNESVGFTEIVDFLKGTSLRYALTHNPTIYDSLVKQFWQTATVRTLANGTPKLVASIDNKEYTITAASISNLPDAEIYDGLATLGYVSEGKLTFWKKNFTPQWKFLIHTILHCLSPKSGGWDQFGSPIATALICLSSNRVYNFSKLIFDGTVHNIESDTKFLMYPRFLQMILGITTENNGKYLAPTLTKKLFANMKRGYAGDYVPLLPVMLAGAAKDQGEGSAISAEPQHIPTDLGPTFTHVADEATTTVVRVGTDGATTTTFGLDTRSDSGNIYESPLRSHEAPLHEGHTSGSAEDNLQLKELMVLVPKLVTRIANLEKGLHQTKTTYGKAVLTLVKRVKSLEVALKRKTKKVVVFDSEDEETENQGRKIQDINDDPLVSLVRESMKEKDTDFVTPTKISASGEVASQKAKSTDKGRRYKRRKVFKGKDINNGLDAEVEVSTGRDNVNTGSIEKRKVEVQEAAQHYTEEDWDTIIAKLEANAELIKSLQGESMTDDDFSKRMVEGIQLEQETLKKQKIDVEDVPKEKGDEPMKNTGKRKKQMARKGIHTDKTAKDETEEDMEAIKKGAPSSGTDIPVNHVPKEDILYQLMDKMMNFSVVEIWFGYLKALMEVRRVWVLANYHTTNGHQFTMLNRTLDWLSKARLWYCTKALATPEQTATGKEISNPLIADSLLKTIRNNNQIIIKEKINKVLDAILKSSN
ncbi:hypothetical protein Tco_0185244 [Tanacetum coccineum]